MPDQQTDRWTLCARVQPGTEGDPIVRDGPPIPLYEHIKVQPIAVADRLAEALRRVDELCSPRPGEMRNTTAIDAQAVARAALLSYERSERGPEDE